jgi:hypothetical protein
MNNFSFVGWPNFDTFHIDSANKSFENDSIIDDWEEEGSTTLKATYNCVITTIC